MNKFYLCYVKNGKCWFTNNWKEQWGDDWNDAPYEYNAGTPYDEWSELIEDNENIFKRKWKHHPIKHKVCYVEFPYCRNVLEPCVNPEYMKDEYNSSNSVEQINKSILTSKPIAWLQGNTFSILPKTTYEDFIKIVKQNDGEIYERK